MVRGRDVAFSGLSNKLLQSRPDTLGRLVFADDLNSYPSPILSCCLFLVLVSTLFLVFSPSRIRKEDHIRTRAALQALLTVIVPTCSLWSGRYIKLARALRSRRRVDIPLEMLFKDIVDGAIEFRNPVSSLAELIGSGATVNGYTIRICIDWKWWINFFEWWMSAKSKLGACMRYLAYLKRISYHPSLGSPRCKLVPGLYDWHEDMPSASSSPLCLSFGPFALTPSTSCPLLCLDCLPHGTIPSLDAGFKILEFTAFSPSLREISAAKVISAIPFIIADSPHRQPRPLVSVLQQLNASYGPNLVINSISNVSAGYEQTLHRLYRSFRKEQNFRATRGKILGTKAWRRGMFLVALEAALVRRGWIERWAVQVTVK